MQCSCALLHADLESVDGTTVLGKLDWTSQYNDPSISSSYQGSQHMVLTCFFTPNSESSSHSGTV